MSNAFLRSLPYFMRHNLSVNMDLTNLVWLASKSHGPLFQPVLQSWGLLDGLGHLPSPPFLLKIVYSPYVPPSSTVL